ncbi:SMI1/KNR4 family protein [Streptomyces sp. NBC_00390]|uniref:SMI1/KNR4 family protein n=1 Tax=Streptomyces sp. NBC_00390 TaxID=2975736 RepID=UPI002E241467
MTGAFDVAEALDGGISDRERAWTFIRGFAAAWGERLTEGDGTPAAELARAEATLGCSLPAALREVYMLLGARRCPRFPQRESGLRLLGRAPARP